MFVRLSKPVPSPNYGLRKAKMCLTVEPAWYNKVLWDWQRMFAITRFFLLRGSVFCMDFTITGVRNVLRRPEDFFM